MVALTRETNSRGAYFHTLTLNSHGSCSGGVPLPGEANCGTMYNAIVDTYQYSIYVLESSTSGRLTYFMPPLNLIPLLLLRPLRLVLPSEDVRRIRIVVLKATHAPFVALIWLYEQGLQIISRLPASSVKMSSMSRSPRPISGHYVDGPRPGIARTPTKAVTPRASRAASDRGLRHLSVSSTGEVSEMMALVQSLSAKVDDLTAMIAGQQTA